MENKNGCPRHIEIEKAGALLALPFLLSVIAVRLRTLTSLISPPVPLPAAVGDAVPLGGWIPTERGNSRSGSTSLAPTPRFI